MNDLFGSPAEFLRIPMKGADVSYLSAVDLGVSPDVLAAKLIEEVNWRSEEVVVYGKRYIQPRLVAWFGDQGMAYTYSGIRLEPEGWTPTLMQIKQVIEEICGDKFNSVLLNLYRNNNDSMGFHSDDERELGAQPVIASLSLGEERTLIFKPKIDVAVRPMKLKLASGSLLLMKGDTQKNWMHGIDKEKENCGPRVNLTFRKIFL